MWRSFCSEMFSSQRTSAQRFLGRKCFLGFFSTSIPRGSIVSKICSSQLASLSSPIPKGWMLCLGKTHWGKQSANSPSKGQWGKLLAPLPKVWPTCWHFSREPEWTFQGRIFCKAFFTRPTKPPQICPSVCTTMTFNNMISSILSEFLKIRENKLKPAISCTEREHKIQIE